MSTHPILDESLPGISYVGTADFAVSIVFHPSRDSRRLPPRTDIRNHSPSGFAWGYGGSGPAQLALAVLLDFFFRATQIESFATQLATSAYQLFKDKVVAGLPNEWELPAVAVASSLVELGVEAGLWREAVDRVAAELLDANSTERDVASLARNQAFAIAQVATAFCVAPRTIEEALAVAHPQG